MALQPPKLGLTVVSRSVAAPRPQCRLPQKYTSGNPGIQAQTRGTQRFKSPDGEAEPCDTGVGP